MNVATHKVNRAVRLTEAGVPTEASLAAVRCWAGVEPILADCASGGAEAMIFMYTVKIACAAVGILE